MAYEDLIERLADDPEERTVTTFPDGSVDVYYAMCDANGEHIEDRETFADRLAEGEPTFPVERESTEPGGQAVNMARQADALGDRVRLYGHLDDPVFDDLGFERVSMGTLPDRDLPARRGRAVPRGLVRRRRLDARGPPDRRRPPAERLAADAVCCGNWASVPGLTGAFHELAGTSIDGGLLLFDPGPVATRSREVIVDLFDALAALESTYDVVFSCNSSELEAVAEAVGIGGTDDHERLVGLRAEAGLTAAVPHAESMAVAATADRSVSVEDLAVEEPVRKTGASDRFDAGLVHALVREWEWEVALALGNACASYAVATAGTTDRAALRSWLE